MPSHILNSLKFRFDLIHPRPLVLKMSQGSQLLLASQVVSRSLLKVLNVRYSRHMSQNKA